MLLHNRANILNSHVLFFITIILSFPPHLHAMTSPYDVLRNYSLPIGLLPKGIVGFELYNGGRFEAKLNGPCTAMFESGVRYNDSVTGTISTGQIANLSGIFAQDLFLWFPVLAIRLDNYTAGIIHFDVGVVDKSYPISLFESPPDCWPVSLASGLDLIDDGSQPESKFDQDTAEKASI